MSLKTKRTFEEFAAVVCLLVIVAVVLAVVAPSKSSEAGLTEDVQRFTHDRQIEDAFEAGQNSELLYIAGAYPYLTTYKEYQAFVRSDPHGKSLEKRTAAK
jgi:hypothetical protein